MRDMVLKNQCVLGTVNAGKDAFERAVCGPADVLRKWPTPCGASSPGASRWTNSQPIQHQTGIKNIIEISA